MPLRQPVGQSRRGVLDEAAGTSSVFEQVGHRRAIVTRWKRASQPASLPPWPAGVNPSWRARRGSSPRARRDIVVSLLAACRLRHRGPRSAAWTRACAGNSCPSIDELGGYDPNQASKVYAADGRLITDLGLERRTVVPLGEMSPVVKAAFVTTEDKRFYEHNGIDWYRVFGAIKNNLFEMRVAEGFSTITMQLARNVLPEDISGRDKSLRRKLREAKVAREIEEQVPQGQDPRALPQPDRSRQPRLRCRGRVPALLRQVGPRPERRRGGHARRDSQGAVALQSPEESRAQHPAPQHGAQSAA